MAKAAFFVPAEADFQKDLANSLFCIAAGFGLDVPLGATAFGIAGNVEAYIPGEILQSANGAAVGLSVLQGAALEMACLGQSTAHCYCEYTGTLQENNLDYMGANTVQVGNNHSHLAALGGSLCSEYMVADNTVWHHRALECSFEIGLIRSALSGKDTRSPTHVWNVRHILPGRKRNSCYSRAFPPHHDIS